MLINKKKDPAAPPLPLPHTDKTNKSVYKNQHVILLTGDKMSSLLYHSGLQSLMKQTKKLTDISDNK